MEKREYSEKDFLKMKFNVFGMDNQVNLLEEFPVLKKYPSFKRPSSLINKTGLIKYVFYAFDRNSPFVLEMPSVWERRVASIEQAGFSVVEGRNRFEPMIEDILISKNFDVNEMIIDFCIMQSDETYFTYVTYQDVLLKARTNLLNNTHDEIEKAKKIGETIEYFKKQLDSMIKDMIPGNDERLKSFLYMTSNAEKLNLSVETYAKHLSIDF